MRIKKVSQTVPTSAQVVNGHSDSTTNSYSCNYVNKLNTYSTTEHRIGTWINGKPLYRKTYVETLTQSAQNVHNDIPLNNLKKIEGYLNNGTQIIPLGFGNDGNYANVIGQEKRLLYLGTWSDGTLYITVEYTKTTG